MSSQHSNSYSSRASSQMSGAMTHGKSVIHEAVTKNVAL